MVKTRNSVENGESLGDILSSDTRRGPNVRSKRRPVGSRPNRRGIVYHDNVNGYDEVEDEEGYVSVRLPVSPSSVQESVSKLPNRRLQHKEDSSHAMQDTPMSGYTERRSSRSRRLCELDLEAEAYNGTRRSTRQKKLLYGTFNQDLIDKHMKAAIATSDAELVEAHIESSKSEEKQDNLAPDEDVDMYSRVKRPRRQKNQSSYNDDEKSALDENRDNDDSESSGSTSDVEPENERVGRSYDLRENRRQVSLFEARPIDSSTDEEAAVNHGRSYDLREHRPRVSLYEAPPIEPQKRLHNLFRHESPPPSIRREATHRSPARKKKFFKKRRVPKYHGNTSTSSSGDSSDDQRRFDRRKVKSMAKSRQKILPMNLSAEDATSGILRDRARVGASLADIDPMSVDRSVNFDSVGGLKEHLRSLKEMIVFPLLYPEVFNRFKIQPPRGVLFHGPPGTGKTLVARALANECSHGDTKVSFFMRKGADCLSKWVGESERQLRLLFDQAYQMRPSIIFFDEIDGLAPVRSSRQDQIHSSIVSTLLALMDGLDSRGEIVVIGATNRIDSIDPALRRPGRFDREFLFSLPPVEARHQILQIHTSQWLPKLLDPFLREVAEKCIGYCGADLKALCTETAIHALRRRYPQIYSCKEKLQLDVDSIEIGSKDFQHGMQAIVPTAQRAIASPACALSHAVKPLLSNILNDLVLTVKNIFPIAFTHSSNKNGGANTDDDLFSDEDEDMPAICEGKGRKNKSNSDQDTTKVFLNFSSTSYHNIVTFRPRLLLSGYTGQGQSMHIGPAILHQMEKYPVHVLDLPSLFGVTAKSPEESCAQIFQEARRSCPSIIYIPHFSQWWDVLSETMQATFCTLLQDIKTSTPLMLLATTDKPYNQLPKMLQDLFNYHRNEVFEMRDPTEHERKAYFEELLLVQATKAPSCKKKSAERILEVLPKAAPAPPRELTESELEKLRGEEEKTLRELRLFLRDVIGKLARDRKFTLFTKPVDVEEVPDYYDIIAKPMDLCTMMSKIDLHKYVTVTEFMEDIELICSNALEYNPDRAAADRAIRHRACALRDTANAIIEAELDSDFDRNCEEIRDARDRRNESPEKTTPKYYYTKPLYERMRHDEGLGNDTLDNYPTRYSRRSRGIDADDLEHGEESNVQSCEIADSTSKYRIISRKVMIARKGGKVKSPWCKPTRRRYRLARYYIDGDGNQFAADEYEIDDDGNLKPKVNVEEKTEDEDDVKEADPSTPMDNISETQTTIPKYSTITKKVHVRRKDKFIKRSPWCKPTRRLSKMIKVFVDSDGNHFSSADYILDDNGELQPRNVAKVEDQNRECNENIISSDMDTSASNLVVNDKLDSPTSVRGTGSPQHPKPETPTSSPTRAKGIVPHNSSENQSCAPLSPSPKQNFTRKRSTSGGFIVDTAQSKEEQHSIVNGMENMSPVNPHEQSNEALTKTTIIAQDSPNKPTSKIMDVDENMDVNVSREEPTKEDMTTPTSRRRTRSHCTEIIKAKQVLQESCQSVVVDMDRLNRLLIRVVAQTPFYGVHKLERLYSHFSHCIYKHRNDYNKTDLIQNLENVFEQYVRN